MKEKDPIAKATAAAAKFHQSLGVLEPFNTGHYGVAKLLTIAMLSAVCSLIFWIYLDMGFLKGVVCGCLTALALGFSFVVLRTHKMWTTDRAVLNEVRKIVSIDQFNEIEAELNEFDCDGYSIVGKPEGALQDYGFSMGGVYINYVEINGSKIGAYAGSVFLPLGGEKYLKFNYYRT